MAYKSVSALAEFNASSGNVVVQSGVTTGDVGILVVLGATNAGDETPVTVTPTKTGLTFTRVVTTPTFPESDSNMWADAFIVTGLTASDVGGNIAVALSATRLTGAQLAVYDSATTSFGTPGNMNERSGTNADIAAPSMSCSAAQLIVMLALDRSPAGTGYSTVSNANGRTVTVRNYSEGGGTSGNISVMFADFVETGTTTGDTTVTYNHTSANAMALHIPAEITATNHTQSPTDNEGLTDSSVIDRGTVLSESEGVTDSRALDVGTTLAVEAEGLTDTRAIDTGKVQDEALGLSDTLTQAHDKTLSVEALGLTETVDVDLVQTFTLSLDESIGVTDMDAEESIGVEETLTESVGITDTLASDLAPPTTDPLGVTDSLALDRGTALADSEGLTDTAQVSLVWARTQQDDLGLSDSVALGQERATSDTADLSDVVTSAQDKTVADTSDLSDNLSVQILSAGNVNVEDVAGLVDETVFERDTAVAEQADLTDSLVVEILSVFADVVGTSDALDIAAEFQRVLDETQALTDSATIEAEFLLVTEDSTGLTDSVNLTFGVPRDIAVSAIIDLPTRAAVIDPPTREALVNP